MNKSKKIKKLEKQLSNRDEMVRYWTQSYLDARFNFYDAVNEQEMTIKVIAKILKEMQRSG